jgi:hypothetical protein
MSNPSAVGNSVLVVGASTYAAIISALTVSGSKDNIETLRFANIQEGLADGLTSAFQKGILQVGVSDFLAMPFDAANPAAYPFKWDNEEILDFVEAKTKTRPAVVVDGYRKYVEKCLKNYGECLHMLLGNHIDEVEMAELEFMEQSSAAVQGPETQVEEQTASDILLNATADLLDQGVSVYEALFSDETVQVGANAVVAPVVEPITEKPISPIEEPEVVLDNQDLAVEIVPSIEDTPIRGEEIEVEAEAIIKTPTLEVIQLVEAQIQEHLIEVLEAKIEAHAQVDAQMEAEEVKMERFVETLATQVQVPVQTPVFPKAEIITQPADLAATVAQVGNDGLFAAMAPKQTRKFDASKLIKQAVEARLETTKKPLQASRQKSADKFARKQVGKQLGQMAQASDRNQVQLNFNVGKVDKEFAESKALHSLYPCLDRKMANVGIPSAVSRVSMNYGKQPNGLPAVATAGFHKLNVEEGFFYPSCVISVLVKDRFSLDYYERQITVPYVIEAPIQFIQTSKGGQPNMVITDSDTIRCCEPIWIPKSETKDIFLALKAGHKMIGEYKPFHKTMEFIVFQPKEPKWKNLNHAVEFSTPYPLWGKAKNVA